jgi:RNA polymerase sigma-70 factor (ECF subfamily)
MADEPDGELLRRFVQGDRDAFETLFTTFHVEVHRWALRIVRDASAADDVVVEAFWRAYRGRARFDTSRSFGAWLRRIATNAARDHLRVVRRHAARLRNIGSDGSHDAPAPPVSDRGVVEAVERALRSLPPRLQVVATLALIEERPYSEIADALDVPIGTVKSRVFRATRALRHELARLGIQP